MAEKEGSKEPEAAPPHQPEPEAGSGNANQNVPPVSGPFAATTPQPCPAKKENPEAKPERKWTHDIGMFGATVAGVFVVGAYTLVAAWQANIQQSTLNEMQAEKRPWVTVKDPTMHGPIKVNQSPNGPWMYLPVSFTVTNTGGSPAIDAQLRGDAFDMSDMVRKGQKIGPTQDAACTPKATEMGSLVAFPNTDTKTGMSLTLSADVIANFTPATNDGVGGSKRLMMPIVAGCILYSVPGDKNPHHTIFEFHLSGMENGKCSIFMYYRPEMKTIDACIDGGVVSAN